MTEQKEKVVAKTKRIDIHTSTIHSGLLELQRAIQQGYVIDFSATPARARASRMIVTLVGAEVDTVKGEVVESEVETKSQVKQQRKKTVDVKIDEKE